MNVHPSSEVRKTILRMAVSSKEGHIASSFSIIEILVAIYEYHRLKGATEKFLEKTILSKGHAVFALYGLLNYYKLLSDEEISKVCQDGSCLIGHVPVLPQKGFYVGTGSLGQGIGMALGQAYASEFLSLKSPQFVIIGDGELNEGACWESLLLMKKFPNMRLRLIIDNNLSSNRAIPLAQVFEFIKNCWKVVEVDGHSIDKILEIFQQNDNEENLIVICNTIKGYPLSAMMNNPVWHHKTPTLQELSDFILEIDNKFGIVS